MRKTFFDEDLSIYQTQQKTFRAINTFIGETVSKRIIDQIAHTSTDTWSTLRALQHRLRPSRAARSLAIEKRYEQQRKGPTNQNIEAWLNEWTDVYHEARRLRLGEVADDRAIRDLFLAINNVDPIYATSRQNARDLLDDQNEELDPETRFRHRWMDEEIEKFRNRTRLLQTSSTGKNQRTALATEAKAKDPKLTLKGKD